MALGATHYTWRDDVGALVGRVRRRFPSVTANTYKDHPWPGWDSQSVDFWGRAGRGSPIPGPVGHLVLKMIFEDPAPPHIRHLIYRHDLWTPWGGWQRWEANDHSGQLRHIHVTYF